MFFIGQDENKIALLHFMFLSALFDQTSVPLYHVIEVFKRMRMKRGMPIRLNGKDTKRKVRGAILLRYGNLPKNILCAFHVRPDLFNLIET